MSTISKGEAGKTHELDRRIVAERGRRGSKQTLTSPWITPIFLQKSWTACFSLQISAAEVLVGEEMEGAGSQDKHTPSPADAGKEGAL